MTRPRKKNRNTRLKEAIKRAQATKKKKVVEQPLPPPPPLPRRARNDDFLPIQAFARHRCELLCEYYGASDGIDEKVQYGLDMILLADTLEEAEERLEKTVNGLFISLLAQWARRRIPGPDGVRALQRKLSSRKGLVLLMEKSGNKKKAEQYRAEVKDIERALEVAKDPPPPWRTPEWNQNGC